MTEAAAAPSLAEAWEKIKTEEPGARARDVAARLGVSEGALVDARLGRGADRLRPQGPEFARLVEALPDLGPIMSLARNEAAVHEVKAAAETVAGMGAMGQVTGPIDLRIFYRAWHAGYLVEEPTRSGLRRSFQVFDPSGTAVIKIYAVDGTDEAAWARLAAEFTDLSPQPARFAPAELAKAAKPDSEIDVEALRQGWAQLDHTHDFHKLLMETGAAREQALRLAGPEFARPAGVGVAKAMLEAAATQAVPIMCFVGNKGAIQIFSGAVTRIVEMGPWINVLDEGFNLHLRQDKVAAAWLVTKPTRQRGPITSIELFDTDGEMVCQFFGVRPENEGERPEWRALAEAAARGEE